MKRKYFLPIGSLGFDVSNLCKEIGALNNYERSLVDVQRAVQRAASGQYESVIFPENILFHPLRDEFINVAQDADRHVIVQIDLKRFTVSKLEVLEELFKKKCSVSCLFREWEPQWNGIVQHWNDLKLLSDLICVPSPENSNLWLHNLRYIPENLRHHISFHFRSENYAGGIPAINSQIANLKRRFPEISVKTPNGMDIWEARVVSDLSLEPLDAPTRERTISTENLKFSVIIPCYNNRDYLLNVLDHLLSQTIEKEVFEIIVVDDGSSDGSQEAVADWLSRRKDNFNFKYIYSPRPRERKMGDGMYRAGIARNLGVKYSKGDYLCFLDSDILTPPNYLEQLLCEHQKFDVIQTQRLNLKMEYSGRNVKYDEVNKSEYFFATEGGYWETFYATKEWMKLPLFWKYTCTYGLSLKRSLFCEVGWFRKTFIFYGFEDSELGYRLNKAGATFHLSDLKVLHLCHKTERSEFKNDDFERQNLLTKTAEILYLNTLDSEIFEHFKHMYKRAPSMIKRLRLYAWLLLNKLRAQT